MDKAKANDPNETYLNRHFTIKNRITATITEKGAIRTEVPRVVATPLPPLNRIKRLKL